MPSCSSANFGLGQGIDDGTPHNPELHIMPERVDRQGLGNSSKLEPVSEPQLHLARAKPAAGAGTEQWRSIGQHVGIYVQTNQSAELRVEEHRFLSSTLCSDCDGPLSDVGVTGVQTDQRAEPDASTEQEREHRVVSFGNGGVGVCDRAEQSFRLVRRQIARYSPVGRCRANQPCGVVCEITRIRKKTEEHSKRSFGSVDGQRGARSTVPIRKEASECVGSDRRDLNIALEPALELAQIPQVSLPRALALSISRELRVEAFDSCRKLHGFTSLQFDSQATSMNALLTETVNSIMRTICLNWPLSWLICPVFAHVDATQALCAPISVEVGIDA